jgi:hypothetical protein
MLAASWAQQSTSVPSDAALDSLDLPVLAQPDLVFASIGDSEVERHRLSRTGSMD